MDSRPPYHILYLEDNLVDVDLVRRALKREELPVELCHVSGREAFLRALREKSFDLIMTDLSIPGYDGTEAVREARAFDEEMPVIILSGTIGEQEAQKLLRAGATDYILKERLSWLVPVIERALRESTQRREDLRAIDALRERESSYRTLMEFSPDATFITSAGTIVLTNRSGLTLLGAENEKQVIGRGFTDFLEGDNGAALGVRLETLVGTGDSLSSEETRMTRFDGSVIDVEVKATSFTYRDRAAALIVVRDITERKRAEAWTRLSEQILQKIGSLVLVINTEGQIIFTNEAVQRILGYAPADVLGDGWWERVYADPAARREAKERAAASARGELPITEVPHERSLIGADGRERIVLWSRSIGPGNLLITVGHDITSSKAAQRALEASEQKFHSLVDAMGEGFIILDPEGRISYANQKFADMLGVSAYELNGQPFTQFIGEPDQQELFSHYYAGAHEAERVANNVDVIRPNGERLTVLFSPQKMSSENGDHGGSFAVVTDLTAVRRLEEEVRQMQKMESLGTLAGGIAHDFNNILTIILAHASVLKSGNRTPEQNQKSLDSIMIASRRGANIVRQILTFARRSETNIEPVAVNEVIRELIALIRDTFPRTVLVASSLAPDLPLVNCDRTQLHQTILNLCVNARDAMLPEGGTLTLSSAVVLPAELPPDREHADAPRFIRIEVRDTGMGMDEPTSRRIFEPFFTTKGHAQGTGLGLAVVYGIVQHHNGLIDVESEVGKGTTFRIYLPVL